MNSVGVLIWNIDDYSKVNSTQIKYLAQLKFTLANYPVYEPGLFSTSLNILQNRNRPIAVSASNQIFDHSIQRYSIFGILHIPLVTSYFFWEKLNGNADIWIWDVVFVVGRENSQWQFRE